MAHDNDYSGRLWFDALPAIRIYEKHEGESPERVLFQISHFSFQWLSGQ